MLYILCPRMSLNLFCTARENKIKHQNQKVSIVFAVNQIHCDWLSCRPRGLFNFSGPLHLIRRRLIHVSCSIKSESEWDQEIHPPRLIWSAFKCKEFAVRWEDYLLLHGYSGDISAKLSNTVTDGGLKSTRNCDKFLIHQLLLTNCQVCRQA